MLTKFQPQRAEELLLNCFNMLPLLYKLRKGLIEGRGTSRTDSYLQSLGDGDKGAKF